MIKLEQVSIYIDGISILDEVNVEMKESHIYVLFGENGSGKTTLMKTIAGMIDYDKGTIHKENSLALQDFVYIGDEPILYDELTGKEHIDFCYSLFQSSYEKYEVDKLTKQFQIDQHLHKKIKDYSLGMQKKLQLLCVFISQARVLLLDEFISGLDVHSLDLLKKILKDFTMKKGHSVIFCSHILDFAEEVGDVFIQIRDGKIVDKFDKVTFKAQRIELKEMIK